MAFRARWRELKKAGWHSKKPAGLSVDFTYLKPSKTKKDIRGEDYFVGEEELMTYLDKMGIAALEAKKTARREGSANAQRVAEKRAAEAMTTTNDGNYHVFDKF
ncbi:hypothetical protein PInf_005192 [Phytophthora infestans]|nr:hypothetical protein PInf_005192 [Phytophthora infestans]